MLEKPAHTTCKENTFSYSSVQDLSCLSLTVRGKKKKKLAIFLVRSPCGAVDSHNLVSHLQMNTLYAETFTFMLMFMQSNVDL